MAFRMNRSIIKGTVNHKASIAKAKKAVVSQARVKADPTLVKSGELLGKSYIPEAIDYTIDQPEIKIPEKKELTEEEKAARDARRKARKAKKDADKTKKDTWYRDVDEDGNIITRGWQSIKDKIKANKAQNEIDYQLEQEAKAKIQTDKDALKVEADKKNQAELDKKEISKALELERKNEEKLKKRLVREEAKYQKEQERIAAEAKRKQMSKKEVIKVGPPETTAIGGEQIQQYTKEQKERLAVEGVWNDDAEKIVLPEEVDTDGSYTPKGEGTIIEPIEISSEKRSEMTAPTAGLVKPNRRDFKNSGDYMRARMNYYKALESEQSKTVMQMRDDRIYRNAIKDGKVQANMRKSGYIPQNER